MEAPQVNSEILICLGNDSNRQTKETIPSMGCICSCAEMDFLGIQIKRVQNGSLDINDIISEARN